MNWINPRYSLPKEGQTVWVMLYPHKERGNFLNSAMSIEIVCGEVSFSNDGTSCRVENCDELGMGAVSWYLKAPEDFRYGEPLGMAWLPLEDVPCPGWDYRKQSGGVRDDAAE